LLPGKKYQQGGYGASQNSIIDRQRLGISFTAIIMDGAVTRVSIERKAYGFCLTLMSQTALRAVKEGCIFA